jgi:hypothetical protein
MNFSNSSVTCRSGDAGRKEGLELVIKRNEDFLFLRRRLCSLAV